MVKKRNPATDLDDSTSRNPKTSKTGIVDDKKDDAEMKPALKAIKEATGLSDFKEIL